MSDKPLAPNFKPFHLKFLLSVKKDEAASKELKEIIVEDGKVSMYKDCCECFGWTYDNALVETMERKNAAKVEELEQKIKEAVNQYGDVEHKDALLERASHYALINDVDKAVAFFKEILKHKGIEANGKLQVNLTIMRLAIFNENTNLAQTALEEIETQLEKGGDWETRNRACVYRGLHLVVNERKFEQASKTLVAGLSTFTATELISLTEYACIAVITALVSLTRSELKTLVAKQPQILQVFAEHPTLKMLFQSYIACDYASFFQNYSRGMNYVKESRYLAPHYRYIVRRLRLIAYRQYLQPYSSVSLPVMAQAFGVTPDFMEAQIVSFVPSGKLSCQIDKLTNTIHSLTQNQDDEAYETLVAASDTFTNNLQVLSRVIDM